MNETQMNKILDAQFARFFGYVDKRFYEFEIKLDQKADRHQMDHIYEVLDDIVGTLRDIKVEIAAQSHQFNRHEAWIKKTAHKINLNYDLMP